MRNASPTLHRTGARNYSERPLLIYWELTQACALTCRHCRAEASPHRHPFELNTSEGKQLLRQIAGFGDPLPHLILTGGDPLERPDIFELIDEACALGITVSITPSATERLTREMIIRLHNHGIQSMGLSLDGATPKRHDKVRGIPGCFERTMRALRDAEDLGLPVQINTLVAEETADELPAIYNLLTQHRVMRWALFFLIGVGRGQVLREVTPELGEELMRWIYLRSLNAPFAIKTTEAPSYRRVALETARRMGIPGHDIRRSSISQSFGIRDGNGIVFVSHTGAFYPSGFLPLPSGHVRTDNLVDVYRSASLFCNLRDSQQLKGKCGRCEYRVICGGSRARAFAATGDPLESDPLCPYQPGESRRPPLNQIFEASNSWPGRSSQIADE